LLRSEDGVIDTFRVNPAVVPRQEQQAFIPIYRLRTIENRSKISDFRMVQVRV
jgi:hypothetical protein